MSSLAHSIFEKMNSISNKLTLYNISTSSVSDELLDIADLLNDLIDTAHSKMEDGEDSEALYTLIDELRATINTIDDIEIALVEGDSPYHLNNRLRNEIDAFKNLVSIA